MARKCSARKIERQKLHNAHFDGHELITPEQTDGYRADDLDGGHGGPEMNASIFRV